MTLAEFKKRFGIKRIDFSKVERSDLEEQCGSDKLICPYCEGEIEYESEEIDSIIRGEAYQCPHCDKWFYAEGEVSIDTWCTPMADKVLDSRKHIERAYQHMDECEKGGVEFNENRYGNVEWETYYAYALPLIENGEMEGEAK